jgi:hypothetical protein
MDRQWSNKLECDAAQARRVVMAYELAGVHREELKDKQPLSLHGTAQLPSKWIRNEQDRPKCIRYFMEHQEEKRACSNLQSLRRPCLPCLAADSLCLLRLQYLSRARMRFIIPMPTY